MKLCILFLLFFQSNMLISVVLKCPLWLSQAGCIARTKMGIGIDTGLGKLQKGINSKNSDRVKRGCRCNPTLPPTGTCFRICGELTALKKAQKRSIYLRDYLVNVGKPSYVALEEKRIRAKLKVYKNKNRYFLRDKYGLPIEERPDHTEKFKWDVVRPAFGN